MRSSNLVDPTLLLGSGGGLLAVVLIGRWRTARWHERQYEGYKLEFPRDLDPTAVAAFITSVSGLLPRWWRRPLGLPAVALEVSADAAGIAHHLIIARPHAGYVLGQLRAAIPGARTTLDPDYRIARVTAAAELTLTSAGRQLRVDHPETVTAAILASLQPLELGESAVLSWLLAPSLPPRPARAAATKQPGSLTVLIEGVATSVTDSESLQALRTKQASPMLLVVGRVGVHAATAARRHQLMARLLGALHVVGAPGVHLRQRLLPSFVVRRRLQRRTTPLTYFPLALNVRELTALTALPLGGPPLAGLWLGTARRLPVSPDIPTGGMVLAQSNFGGADRPIAVSWRNLSRHLVATGPTGSGKSTLLLSVAIQVMQAGLGLILIDPHGDTSDEALNFVPRDRVRQVAVVDPGDGDYPIGLNVITGSHGDIELVVEQIVALFHQLYADSWGPRTDDILRAALRTLAAASPTMTLAELPHLLTSEEFRARLVTQVDDSVVRNFWSWFERLSPSERANIIAPVSNKVRAFLMRRRIRNILGQAESTLDFDRVLAEGQLVFVRLPAGTLGAEVSALMGSLIVTRLWQAAMRRTALPPSERHQVVCIIDELQRFLHSADAVEEMLAEARKLNLAMVMAHQHLGQLSPGLQRAVRANARTKVAFAPSADDARVLAREFEPLLSAEDLRFLGPYEVAISVALDSNVAPATTGTTVLPTAPTGSAVAARAWSRQQHGRPVADVEAELRQRQTPSSDEVPIRRRRRTTS